MLNSTVQRKPSLKTRSNRDVSIYDRLSDDEAIRRKPFSQLIQRDRNKKFSTLNDIRRTNNQLNILRQILLNERDINDIIQKTNRTEQNSPKGKSQHVKKAKSSSIKNLTQFEIDNFSVDSNENEQIDNESMNLSRFNKKDYQQNLTTRSTSLFSQSRPQSGGVRSVNNVSFQSDLPKHDGKSNGLESTINSPSGQLKKLFDRLSFELNDLESTTGFKSNKIDSSSNTCSAILAKSLITLTNHVKQSSLGKQELNQLKDQLSIVVKNQLDFQQKIENQMITLQTMMQTLCQLVNNDLISNRKCPTCTTSSILRRDPYDMDINQTKQKSHLLSKDTSHTMNDLLTLTRRMSNDTNTDTTRYRSLTNDSDRHSAFIETLEASKKLTRPTSSSSTKESNGNDVSKQTHQYTKIDQDIRSSMISPIDTPSSYDILESNYVSNENLSNVTQSASRSETILEKILQERLRLVQQMAELNKQHESTQEELVNLESRTATL